MKEEEDCLDLWQPETVFYTYGVIMASTTNQETDFDFHILRPLDGWKSFVVLPQKLGFLPLFMCVCC
jgi:hypothetical protein